MKKLKRRYTKKKEYDLIDDKRHELLKLRHNQDFTGSHEIQNFKKKKLIKKNT